MAIFLIASSGFFVVLYILTLQGTGTNKKNIMYVVDKATSSGNKLFLYIKEVRIGYLVSNGNKHYPSISNTAEIFIFEDFILVIRKQHFLMVTYLKPIVISAKNWNHLLGPSIESLTPIKFIYWERRRKEVQIQLIDLQYNHITPTLALKQLTDEQINEIQSFEKRIELS